MEIVSSPSEIGTDNEKKYQDKNDNSILKDFVDEEIKERESCIEQTNRDGLNEQDFVLIKFMANDNC